MTALITAIYGGYDWLKPLRPNTGFSEAVCVTDDPTLQADGWRVVVDPAPPGEHPRLSAKRPRCLPWEYVDDDTVLWLDGSFIVADGAAQIVDQHLADGDLVLWRHPSGRIDAYEEAEFSAPLPKYRDEPLREQCKTYHLAGLPTGSGLWETGMLARRRTRLIEDMGRMWLNEIHRHTIQDQVSLPYVLWRLGIEPVPWRTGSSHWDCGWAWYQAHADENWP